MDDGRLQQFLAASLTRRARWGRDDCLLWAGRCAEAITGHDPVAPVRGEWRNKREGLARIARLGPDRLAAMRAQMAALGMVEIAPREALPGDLGLVNVRGLLTSACFLGQGWAVRGVIGFAVLKTAVSAWCVPRYNEWSRNGLAPQADL